MFVVLPSKKDIKDFPENAKKNWKPMLLGLGITIAIFIIIWIITSLTQTK